MSCVRRCGNGNTDNSVPPPAGEPVPGGHPNGGTRNKRGYTMDLALKLRHDVAAWNIWREQFPQVQIDLAGANLESAYLAGADLESADLRCANLESADLAGAYLESADLRGADLRGANLRGASLWGASLAGAILCDANLDGAIVSYRGKCVRIVFEESR